MRASLSLSLAIFGCTAQPPSTTAVAAPPNAPAQSSFSLENPGGNASDPERAALQRLIDEPFRADWDRYGTMHIYLAAQVHWSRTHMFGVKTRAAFHFGDERWGVSGVWYEPASKGDSPDACLDAFLASKRSVVSLLGTEIQREKRLDFSETKHEKAAWMGVADVARVFDKQIYIGGLVATRSWPGTCLVQGMALIATRHPDLARRAVERWIEDGAPRLTWQEDVHDAPKLEMIY